MICTQLRKLTEAFRGSFRYFVLFTVAAFIVSAAIGFGIGFSKPDLCVNIANAFVDSIEQSGVIQSSGSMSAWALMRHNLTAMFAMTLSGAVPFLFLPFIYLLSNSILLGIAAALYLHSGLSPALFLAGLLPHGIFELPAIILSLACGFNLCFTLCHGICKRTGFPEYSAVVGNILRVILLVVVPCTALAALVECYVTPLIQSLFI